MIGVNLFIHIHGARGAAGCIEALAYRIEHQIIRQFSDGKCLEFLASLGIEHDDLSAAASDKQAMMRFIKREGVILLTESDGPNGEDFKSIPVNYFNLVFPSVIQ